ncbi:hypothetical protein [Mucilaginibacter myungsuensis]|uniref:Outer membrane protein with beta-barrel domain n=1 Tax=Mucilaginibacter myungsuensis TaxID=649104 RepID=A0A929PZ87_9SPHI|nr:hypothetical protein [Mucilaginibacter myungsuensis]MBE9664250.1 hypothetical protein [Mucilaginibacter myungsuensis]MDN3599954.1 hypothetical protein [Mucilaginibacter myungsuensis]
MKKFTFIALVTLLAGTFTAKAQIQEGNVMVGGNLSNINFGLNSPNVFSLNITPKAAWFVVDNVALGGYVNLGVQTAKGSSTVFDYGAGGLGRYYTGNDVAVLKHGRFFGEANVGIGGRNVSNGGANTNGLALGFGPGFAYFITPNIGLETLLKYNGNVGFGSQTYAHDLNLSFGFQIYLPGRSTANKVKGDVRM